MKKKVDTFPSINEKWTYVMHLESSDMKFPKRLWYNKNLNIIRSSNTNYRIIHIQRIISALSTIKMFMLGYGTVWDG